MGKFPTFESSANVSEALTSGTAPINTEKARAKGDMYSALGEAAEKLTSVVATQEAARASHRATDAAGQAQLDAQIKAKADGSDYSQILQTEYQARLAAIDGDLDPLARHKFVPTRDALQVKINFEGESTALQMKVKNYSALVDQNLMSGGSIIQNDPTTAVGKLVELREWHKEQVRVGIPASVATRDFIKGRQYYAHNYIQGMLLKGQSSTESLYQLQHDLKSSEAGANIMLSPEELTHYGLRADGENKVVYKDEKKRPQSNELSELLRGVSPDERFQTLDHINKLFSKQAHGSLSNATKTLEAFVRKGLGIGKTGKATDSAGTNEADVEQLRAAIANAPPAAQPQLLAQAKEAMNLHQYANVIAVGKLPTAIAHLEARRPKPTDDPNGPSLLEYDATNVAIDSDIAKLKKLDAQRVSDPAPFYRARDKHLNELYLATKNNSPEAWNRYATELKAVLVTNNAPSILVSSEEAKNIAYDIESTAKMGANASDVMLLKIGEMRTKYGDDLGSVLVDTVKMHPTAPKSLSLLGTMSNEESISTVTKNIANEKYITKSFGELKSQQADMTDGIEGIHSKLAEIFYGGHPENRSNPAILSMVHAIGLEAKRLLVEDTSKAASSMLDQAYETIVTKNYNVAKTARTTVYIPSKYDDVKVKAYLYDNDPERSSYSRFSNDQEQIALGHTNTYNYKLKQYTPAAWGFENSNRFPGKDVVTSSDYALWQRHARIKTTPDQAGIQLVWDVGDGKNYDILNSEGKRMIISFKDLGRYDAKNKNLWAEGMGKNTPAATKEMVAPPAYGNVGETEDLTDVPKSEQDYSDPNYKLSEEDFAPAEETPEGSGD